jgi:7-cyano-7-deazaguanine synthase
LEAYQDFASMDAIIGNRVEKTFVPMRNSLFLTLAANRAVVNGAQVIITGVCEADNANYPDCRVQFIAAQEWTINEALGFNEVVNDTRRIRISAPLIQIAKAASIEWMNQHSRLGWLAFTHTAYDGSYPPVSKDHASVLRAQGFLEANLPDPLVLRAVMDGLMDMPQTTNYFNIEKNYQLFSEIQVLKGQLV